MSLLQVTLDFTQAAQDAELPGSSTTFPEWMSRILSGMLVIGALLVLIYLLWGALSWITSGGDKAKLEQARERMTQAVIGLIVLAAILAIFGLVQTFLGVEIFVFDNTPVPNPPLPLGG